MSANCANTTKDDGRAGAAGQFDVTSERVVWQRYLTLYDRRVKFPNDSPQKGREFDYDIIGHPRHAFHFAVCFPFHPPSGERPAAVTIIREYAQGPNCMMYNLPCGGFDPAKHASYEDCIMRELSEETRLTGGALERLIPVGHSGLSEVKWCANRFTPFLVVDPITDVAPGRQDAEELIEVQRVSLAELKAIMHGGEMLLPAITTAYLALDRLEALGYAVR